MKFSIKFEDLGYTNSQIVGISLFHAVSAFNNAGFDLFGSSSLTANIFASNVLFNLNTALYNTNDYEGTITPGKKYEMFATSPVDITTKSSFINYSWWNRFYRNF